MHHPLITRVLILAALGAGTVAFVACSAERTVAQRSAVPADINDRFLDPALDAGDWVNRWEVESREIYASRHAIVDALALAPGQTIADIGSGTGLFLAPFSRAVTERGRVYAIDISPRFVEHIARRIDDEGLVNVEPILSREDSTELAPNSVDIVFVCDTYHHFEYHEAMLRSIRRALRRGGRLVIIDFERIPGISREWILGHVRAGKEVVTSEIEAAGFTLIDEVEIAGVTENYVLFFEKR